MTDKDLALPKGSTILVSGASGYIGAHVINEALKFGYKVVGTARTQEKADNTKKVFNNNPDYSTVIVEDFQHEGAFDEAVKGIDAVIHVASDTTFSADPNKVIPSTVSGVRNILNSALNSSSVKSFVLTSSSSAATLPKPGKKFHIDANSWNDEGVEIAWRPPPYEQDRAFAVYSASKTEGERAFWQFQKEKQPQFRMNAVLPNFNIGKILTTGGATGDAVPSAFKGKPDPGFDPQYMIDVIDNARVHVAAAVDGTVKNERIFTFNVPFNWNDIIVAVRKLRPDAEVTKETPDLGRDLSTVDNKRGTELLKKWWNQDGYKTFEQSVEENLEGVE